MTGRPTNEPDPRAICDIHSDVGFIVVPAT